MSILFLIALSIAYVSAGAWTFGYVRGAVNDQQNGWETPLPLFSAILWPLTLLGAMVILPVQRAGFAFQQHKLEKRKQRIALQEKVRIEIQEAEKELEAQFEELAEELEQQDQKEIKKKKKIEQTARLVDDYLFDKSSKKASRGKKSS